MSEARVLIDGRSTRSVDALDRGLQYGDGLFETMFVARGEVRLLEFHVDRLEAGCRRLAIPPPGRSILRREVTAAARRIEAGVLKLIVTRGPGQRGYRPPERPTPTRILIAQPDRAPRPNAAVAPIRLRICRTRLGINPLLAGLKTLNRLECVLARAEWRDPRIAEGLMRDAEGHIVCGTMTNLFLRRGRELLTPRLDRCGVAGVMRRWVIAEAPRLGLRCREVVLDDAALASSEEVFVTNAVRGVSAVAGIAIGRQRLRYESFEAARRFTRALESR